MNRPTLGHGKKFGAHQADTAVGGYISERSTKRTCDKDGTAELPHSAFDHNFQFDTCEFRHYQAVNLVPGSFRADCEKLDQPSSKNRIATGSSEMLWMI